MLFHIDDKYSFQSETGTIFLNESPALKIKGNRVLILKLLFERSGIVTREEIMNVVWGKSDVLVYGPALTQQVYLLRKELKLLGLSDIITSYSKLGYAINISNKQHDKNLRFNINKRFAFTGLFFSALAAFIYVYFKF
jgi:DNA-binding winged helix-turn-helix (wHTH) protein